MVGKAPVMVCLSDSGESQYYYLRHRRGIRLMPSEATDNRQDSVEALAKSREAGRLELDEPTPGEDGEDQSSGHWSLQATSPTEISGTWTAPHHGDALPISLHKVNLVPQGGSPDATGQPCGKAYYESITAGMRLTSRPATFEGHAYREVSSDEATAIEAPAALPHAQALNRYAKKWLDGQSMLAYDCKAGRGNMGAEPIGSSLKPVLWTDQYLVLQDLMPEIYCGGAHGSSSLSYLTWSWSQGRVVDTWSWLQGGEKSLGSHAVRQGQPLRSGLFRLIARRHPRNEDGDDCREALDFMNIQQPYPTPRGLVFNTSFAHVMRACDDQVTLEWQLLMPYLSDEGRALLKQFRQ